tara:strand:- start:6536 stop:7390 length:855 start_codon:yes stop_codon:yes gene_type:complete
MTISREIDEYYNFLKPKKFNDLIRIGNKYDGGYIVPKNLLKETDGLLSFGYGYDPSFEYEYIELTNKKVFIYDYSCSLYYLIKFFLKYLKRFLLFKKKLKDVAFHYGNLKKHINFLRNKKINYQKKKIVPNKIENSKAFVSTHSAGEVPFLTSEVSVDHIFNNCNLKKLILKCDIEGTEYLIIDDILKHHERIDIITMEFHWVDKNLKDFEECIKKILQYFAIVHIHGNNHYQFIENINIPIIPEITFVKKKYITERSDLKEFPVKDLDNPNNRFVDDLFFHFK